jgi:transcriptional regulator with XRE-family HTH domain
MPRKPSSAAALKRVIADSEAPSGRGPAIGPAVRDRRRRLGLTLQALAEKAQLSAPFISQLERGLTTPSIVSLMAIAGALGVEISYFVSVPKQGQIVRRGETPEVIDVGTPVEYRRLSGEHEERKMEALLMIIPPGLTAPTTRRDGEGFWYVLEGELEMTVGAERFVLAAGDSAHFDQRHPCRMGNAGTTPIRLLWVGAPALF